MGNLTFVVKDSGTGEPIQNAEVIADVSNQPCGFLAIGCSSGNPYTLDGYTDKNGKVVFSLKYNTATTVSYQVLANGYNTQNGSFSISGANIVDWNVWYTKNVNMVATPNTAPPGQGIEASLTSNPEVETILKDLGYKTETAGLIGSIELTIIVVFVSIAVVVGLIFMAVMNR